MNPHTQLYFRDEVNGIGCYYDFLEILSAFIKYDLNFGISKQTVVVVEAFFLIVENSREIEFSSW